MKSSQFPPSSNQNHAPATPPGFRFGGGEKILVGPVVEPPETPENLENFEKFLKKIAKNGLL